MTQNRKKLLIGTLAVASSGCGPKAYVDVAKERSIREEAREEARRFIGNPDKEMRSFAWPSPKQATPKLQRKIVQDRSAPELDQ